MASAMKKYIHIYKKATTTKKLNWLSNVFVLSLPILYNGSLIYVLKNVDKK